MYRVNALAYWVILNTLYIFGLTYINNLKVTKVNDGHIHYIDGIALFLSGIVIYKVTFALLHIGWFKLRVMCFQDMKVQNYNLKKEVKRLKKGNANDSEMGSLLSLEQDFVNDEEGDAKQDDLLLDQSCRPDKKMDIAFKKKMEDLKKKRQARADTPENLGMTQYNDADDDDKGFKAADKEEEDDMAFGGQS